MCPSSFFLKCRLGGFPHQKKFFGAKIDFFTITQKVLVAELQILVYRDPHQISYKIGENSVRIGQNLFLVFSPIILKSF